MNLSIRSGVALVCLMLRAVVAAGVGLGTLKGALPTLAFRLLYPSHPYELFVAVARTAGQNWPIFRRFRGARDVDILGWALCHRLAGGHRHLHCRPAPRHGGRS
jgi:glycerol-3-phosphate acyltransferase PlsY